MTLVKGQKLSLTWVGVTHNVYEVRACRCRCHVGPSSPVGPRADDYIITLEPEGPASITQRMQQYYYPQLRLGQFGKARVA